MDTVVGLELAARKKIEQVNMPVDVFGALYGRPESMALHRVAPYYYAAAVPPQSAAHQQNMPYQYAGGFLADPYVVTPPSQSAQPVIMPVGHPGFIYMPPPSTPVFYSVPTAAPAAATPYYYTPDVYVQQTVSLPQQVIHAHAILPGERATSKKKSSVRPLSTSTPLPTEFSSITAPMTTQIPYAGNMNAAHLKYHRNMEQDDVLANLSKISLVSEETIEAENEKDYETQRIPNARYKTKLCKNFGPYAPNYCPYGLRCEFIHPNDKEYALVCSTTSQLSRNPHNVGNMSQNMCNITPETVCEAPPIAVTRSAVKPAPEKILLKNRNIAGSMMCLATTGRREQTSDDSAIGSGSSESGDGGSTIRLRYYGRYETSEEHGQAAGLG
uniref:C3H1-type domain-containing protein n=1 Tax=Angiostrongylus cantonensis TaxID=6313 RepID=A0A0K0CUB1_ANGCA